MKSLSRLSLGLLTLQVSSVLSFAHQFELEGTMTYTWQDHVQMLYSMQVYVQDCQWAIFKTYNWTTNRLVTEMSSDGSFIYCLDRIETNTGTVRPEDYTEAYPNSLIGQIQSVDFPFGTLNTEGITLFYAYASSCYLNTHTNHVIGSIPFNPQSLQRNEAEGEYAKITRGEQPLELPTEISFLAPFQPGTNAVLTTSEFTNFANVQIPMRVSVVHGPTTYEFHAARVSDTCSLKSFKPELPHGAYVTDFRVPHFLGSDPGSFRMATNGWPVLQAE
jgi:hypothetical protein